MVKINCPNFFNKSLLLFILLVFFSSDNSRLLYLLLGENSDMKKSDKYYIAVGLTLNFFYWLVSMSFKVWIQSS